MHIMTASGWRQLTPECVNQVWERVTYNALTKKWEPDSASGTLKHTRTERFAHPSYREFDEEAYRQNTNRWLARIRLEIKQSQERRSGYFDD